MAPPRKFDWDEAQRLRALGLSYPEIGHRLGVSRSAVALACNPEALARDRARVSEWQRQGRCPDCGAQTSRQRQGGGIVSARCIPCAAKAAGTTAREDELRCSDCGEWKPDADFPSNRSAKHARRGRHSTCRPCQTIRLRSQRQRHRDTERASGYRARSAA